MMNLFRSSLLIWMLIVTSQTNGQSVIPLDTTHWSINSRGYVLEQLDGRQAIYISNGSLRLKDTLFQNGTIEYEIRLTDRRGFYGVQFRITDRFNGEEFYFRPHQSGNPDANQATPVVNGQTGWQLYFGPAYSAPVHYAFDEWMHVKLVVNGNQAQVFLFHQDQPTLTWNLKHSTAMGSIAFTSNLSPVHYANIQVKRNQVDWVPAQVKKSPIPEGLIQTWQVSDPFDEKLLKDPNQIDQLVQQRKWKQVLDIEENGAANLAWAIHPERENTQNTVMAKVTIQSSQTEMKLLEFGYSDRVVVICNGQPIYRGNNMFRSRDYRYLGTIGLFDAVYLPLEEGENTIILAVSENFGGWGVMGRILEIANP